MPNGTHGQGKFGPDYPGTAECLEHVASSFNIPGVSIAMPQSSGDPECSKAISRTDSVPPAKTRKLSVDRSDSRKYVHSSTSHFVSCMSLKHVTQLTKVIT